MRRVILALLALFAALVVPARAQAPGYAVVRPGVALRFPSDHGAHPSFRTEWWYVTGWLKTADEMMYSMKQQRGTGGGDKKIL